MEFAEWVVAGLEHHRSGQLPGGDHFFHVVRGRLGDDPRLTAFMANGDPAARRALVGLVAQTVQQDPGFEQQLRAAASGASGEAGGGLAATMVDSGYPPPYPSSDQPSDQQPYQEPYDESYQGQNYPAPDPGPAKRRLLGTTSGIVAVVLILALIGGGVALTLTLAGGGDGAAALAKDMQGRWQCTATSEGTDSGGSSGGQASGTLVIGDGTWSAGGEQGTWTRDGGKITATAGGQPFTETLTGFPGSAGAMNATLTTSDPSQPGASTMVGAVSGKAMVLKLTEPAPAGSDPGTAPTITDINCTK